MAVIKKDKEAILISSERLLKDFQKATENEGYERISYGEWRRLKISESANFVIIHSFPQYNLEKLQIKEYDTWKKALGETLYSYVCSEDCGITFNNSLAAFLINHWKDYLPFNLEYNVVEISPKKVEINQGGYFINNLDLTNDSITYDYSPKEVIYQTTPTSSNNYITTSIENSIDNYIQDWYNSNTTTMYHNILNQLDADGYITKTNNDKEKDNMNTNDLIKFDFGPVSDKQFRMSPYGIAVATNANGWVSYNPKTGEVFNVDIVNFDISKLIYKMPVAINAVSVGDILIHGNQPVFVRSINNSNGTISVLNYANSTVVDILPVRSVFGFNFFTKIISLIDFSQNTANPDNPFGNILPFLMLDDSKESNFDPFVFMFMMNGNNFSFSNNPMLLYFLMSKKETDKNSLLPFLLMNSSNDFNFLNNINLKEEKK